MESCGMNRPLSEELRKITEPLALFGVPVKIRAEQLPKDVRNECNNLVRKPKSKNRLISPRLRMVDGMSFNVVYKWSIFK
jgi:hypothetical protein